MSHRSRFGGLGGGYLKLAGMYRFQNKNESNVVSYCAGCYTY